uniref:Coiled-coil domain-containing protein 25 n=1 Tax=Cacopsylla melanoneura TaxID=428564 RepID=A0A8D8TES1_9HEMI
MVYYFTSNVVSPPVTLFMGFDKYENEELIKWGWPEDVWFHVDKMSSAHVYLRLQPGQTLDDVASVVIDEAAQLCKQNSITGCKASDVDVVYTMWSNLKKTDGMEPGQVAFHKDKEVRTVRIARKSNEVINRLNKTKREEKNVDLRGQREKRDAKEREDKKRLLKEQQIKDKEDEKKRQEEAELRSYSNLMKAENMTSNKETSGYDSDDFM